MSVQEPEKKDPDEETSEKTSEDESEEKSEETSEETSEASEADETREEPPKAAPPEPRREGASWLPLAIALAGPVLFFFVLPPLTRSGLWDPHELNVADLARRIAINLHGAANLTL